MRATLEDLCIGPFQFLIGRLGTLSLFPNLDREEGFQFLIGRLGTYFGGGDCGGDLGFQFLIGRLGTLVTGLVSVCTGRFNSS